MSRKDVPGLVHSSSDEASEDEVEVPWRRRPGKVAKLCDEEMEVVSGPSDSKTVASDPGKKRRVNNVWANVEQGSILDKEMDKMLLYKKIGDRDVESYILLEDKEEHKQEEANEQLPPVDESTCDPSRKRPHVKSRLGPRQINPEDALGPLTVTETSPPDEVVTEIALLLREPKAELIERCVAQMGIGRLLDLYKETSDVEASGGMMTMDGARRRTPGGVFLQLVRNCADLSKDDLKLIFVEQENQKKLRKKARRARRLQERYENGEEIPYSEELKAARELLEKKKLALVKEQAAATEDCEMKAENCADVVLSDNYEIEEGEID